jgi:hypothetical protein
MTTFQFLALVLANTPTSQPRNLRRIRPRDPSSEKTRFLDISTCMCEGSVEFRKADSASILPSTRATSVPVIIRCANIGNSPLVEIVIDTFCQSRRYPRSRSPTRLVARRQGECETRRLSCAKDETRVIGKMRRNRTASLFSLGARVFP